MKNIINYICTIQYFGTMMIVLKLPHPLKWGIRDDCINYSKVIEYMSVDEYIHIIEEGLLWKHIHTQQLQRMARIKRADRGRNKR